MTAHVLLSGGDKFGFNKEIEAAAGLVPGLSRHEAGYMPPEKQWKTFAVERNLMAIYFYNGWHGFAIRSADRLVQLNQKDLFA